VDPLTAFLAVNGIWGQVQVVRKRARGFGQLIAGQIVWIMWEARHFALTWPLMIGTVGYLAAYVWGWRSWRRSARTAGE
jgi:hypothetical protein